MALRTLAAALLLLAALAAGAAWWIVGTQSGLDWALDRLQPRVEGLVLEGARGALAREVRLERIAWTGEAAQAEALLVSGRLSLSSLLTGTLRIDGLRVEKLAVRLQKGDAGGKPPEALSLPLEVLLSDVQIGTLRVEPPEGEALFFSDLRFNFAAGGDGLRLRNASGITPWGRLALDAAMAARAPFAIEAAGTLDRPEARVRARVLLHPFDEPRLRTLEAHAADVDLARFGDALPRTALDVQVKGSGSLNALLAGSVTVRNAQPGALDRARLPLRAAQSRFSFQAGVLTLDGLQAEAAGGSVSGRARIRDARDLEASVELHGIDLQALRSTLRKTAIRGNLNIAVEGMVQSATGTLSQDGMRIAGRATRKGEDVSAELAFAGIDPARLGDYPQGSLRGEATVSGKLASRQLAARWEIRDSTLAAKPFASEGRARLDGERVYGVDALVRWDENRLAARGTFGARKDRLAWTLVAPQPPLEGFSGRIEAKGTASGTLREPRLEFEARSAPAAIAGRLRARELSAKGGGSLAAHRVSVTARGDAYHMEATLQGGYRDGRWTGRLLELVNRGRYPLSLSAPVEISASPESVSVGVLRAALGDGRIALQRFAWSPGRVESAGEFAGLPGAWLLAAAGLADELRSTLLLDGRWAVTSSPELDGTLRLRRAGGDLTVLEPLELALGLREASLEAQFDAGGVNAQLEATAKLGTISAQARTSGIEAASTLQGHAELQLADIRVLTGRLPPQVRVGGRAAVAVDARGTLGAPEIAGTLRGDALTAHLPLYGVYLDQGTLRATLAGKALRVETLSFRGGEGRLRATGTLPFLAGAQGARLDWSAEKLQVLGRPDMRLVVSGSGSALLDAGRAALEGKLQVDSGYLERGLDPLPRLSDDIVVVGETPAQQAKREPIPLDLALYVDLGERFRVREAGFDGWLRGELHVQTPPAAQSRGELRAFGRITAFDATYRAYGKTLAVDPGIVVFDGPLDNPSLQIEAWRRNQEVAAGVRVTGTLQNPRVELVSDPPLPEGAKLSWLVLGRAPGDASGADLALLQTAASAMLGRGDSVPITTRIAEAVGLDELAVRGSSQIETRVVAVGKRLSERLYLTYEQGVGAAAQNLVKIDLSLTDRISLRAQTGTTSGAGVYYRYSWD